MDPRRLEGYQKGCECLAGPAFGAKVAGLT